MHLGAQERAAVEDVVGEAIVDEALVWDRAHVVRVRTAGGGSFVVKRPRAADDADARTGLLQERVGLQLLGGMPGSPAPRLVGVGTGDGAEVLVLEDLPPGPSVADALLGRDRDLAETAVVALAEALADVAAWTRGRDDEHRRLRAEAGLDSDRPHRWAELTSRGVAGLTEAATELGAAVTDGLEDEAAAVVERLTGPGWWRGYVHGDACPDNAALVDGRLRLFDYEHAGFASVVLDASYVVAPFPTCWCFARIPADLSARAESAYRRRLVAGGVPEAGDDGAWNDALAAALASWVLARGPVLGRALGEEDRVWGTSRMQARLFQWMDAFLAVPADPFPAVRALIADVRTRLGARWPDVVLADYPALPTPGDHPTVEPPEWWTPWDAAAG